MVRLTVNEAKDYVGKDCLIVSSDGDYACLIEDKIVGVDSVIHLERCRDRDSVYILNVNEIYGPTQKEKVRVGDTGIFFDIFGDLSLLATYNISTVIGVSDSAFADWPYLSDKGQSYRYFLPMKELPDGLRNL